MKKLLIASLLCAVSAPSSAEVSLLFGAFSEHLGKKTYRDGDYIVNKNPNNRMFGVDYKGWSFGAMDNSFYKTSAFVAKNFDYRWNDNLYTGIKIGAMTGYKDTPVDMSVAPLIQLEAGIVTHGLSTVIGYVPSINTSSRGAVTIHWKMKI